jgi:hypothetical protein
MSEQKQTEGQSVLEQTKERLAKALTALEDAINKKITKAASLRQTSKEVIRELDKQIAAIAKMISHS